MVAGQGLGPLVVGLLSDLSNSLDGRDPLRLALICLGAFSVWGLPHSYFLVKAYGRETGAIV
jgi:hypothetical protein